MPLNELILALTAEEPLVITSGSAESMAHECLGYIPGNMLRGAFVSLWKRLHPDAAPDDDPEFQSLFLNGDVAWGHAMPVCEREAAVAIPACFVYEKNQAFLPAADSEFDGHKHWLCNKIALKEGQTPEGLWKMSRDDGSIPKIKKISSGFMNPRTLHRLVEEREFNIHVALGRERAARDQQLYGYSAIARGARFQGRITPRTEKAAKALFELASHARALYVGHARSAGYGRLGCACSKDPAREDGKTMEGQTFNLYLLSQFMPSPAWVDMREALVKEIERIAGQKPELKKNYANRKEIQGYNSLWNRPRQSRACLDMGGAMRVEFPGPVKLPWRFQIGGGQLEGYGWVLVNPDFLADPLPHPAPGQPAPKKNPCPRPAPESSIIWRILRERSVTRQLELQTTIWLNDPGWRQFLEDVTGKSEPASSQSMPTASQRNNLRDVDWQRFEAMLEKTPGAQWKQATAYCPFTGRKDHLSEIVIKLLKPEQFSAKWKLAAINLPGQPMDRAEEQQFAEKAHKLFVRRLVSLWNKMAQKAGRG